MAGQYHAREAVKARPRQSDTQINEHNPAFTPIAAVQPL
jgi:hypothetical protein